MKKCNHSLTIYSTCETVEVTPTAIIRKCKICERIEVLHRAGKIWVGISVEAEQKRDFERREYAKDLLQPQTKKPGEVNELYTHAYGDPNVKAEVGTQVDDYKI